MIGLGLGVIGYLVYPALFTRELRKNARRLYSGGATQGLLGWHRLTLEPDVLREESTVGAQTTEYTSIERIFEGDALVLVYVNSLQAHVIPREKISAGDLERFLGALRARLQHGPPD